MLDEVAHAGPEHLDPAFVAAYDTKSGFDPSDDVQALVDRGLDRWSTVVDLGAGTGTFALAAAARFGRVVAVDVSTAMLDVLRARAVERAVTNIEVVHAGMLSYEHAGEPADAVFSRNVLHQVPDFWKAVALQRLAHVLRPAGVLRLRDLIYDFTPSEAASVFESWLDGAVDDRAVGYTREDLAQHIRTEHSTYRWLLEPMLAAAGFEIIDAAYRKRVYGAYTCIRA
jgi:ubiquinone/menaquinone biosynthesis C-methylase UbiE